MCIRRHSHMFKLALALWSSCPDAYLCVALLPAWLRLAKAAAGGWWMQRISCAAKTDARAIKKWCVLVARDCYNKLWPKAGQVLQCLR
jgi:hypothetical protein